MTKNHQRSYEELVARLGDVGKDMAAIEGRLVRQEIETPSWGYGDSGTRFNVFGQKGVPRDPFERLEDAARVHEHTGVCPSVAMHIPWDRVEDYGALKDYSSSLGLRLGAVNPNLFQDEAYRIGSVTHPEAAVRRKATDHILECVEIGREVGSDLLSLWLPDGTNYPGQDSFTGRRHRMLECLSEAYAAMPESMRMLVEYKFFEPAFYHTDLADWGSALTACQRLGDRAQVLVDLGHHAQGTNIEHIVAQLLDEGRLGGFHFNNRKYADDDLIVGAINPFELFLIYVELVEAEDAGARIAYMIDQAHNIEPKIEAMILSVTNLQEAYAKAILVDRAALADARREGDVLGAHQLLLDAYNTDVRPLCSKVREDLGASADPVEGYRSSGHRERAVRERTGARGG